MNRDLGVWTSEDCALVLIDYQKEMFEAIRSETDAQLAELNVRWLASAHIRQESSAAQLGAHHPTGSRRRICALQEP